MKTSTFSKILLAALFASISPRATAAEPAQETPEQRDARMTWWRDAKFGMFIHWGLYAVPAGVYQDKPINGIGEWIMKNAMIPVETYAKYADGFNPTQFDARKWVKMAKDAGMKYIVITSKHHDGFAMFHSKASPYNIFDATPFKRDPLKELAAACKEQDMKLGFYYSQCQDWHHPGGGVSGDKHWDPAQEGSFDDYLDKVAIPQVKEILTNYGPVSVLWWDTPNKMMTPERCAKLAEVLKLQPQIIYNNRLGGGYKGDTETPEQHIPATGFPGRDWESCMTMNDTWGYKSADQKWKSPETLLRNLIDIASKGGNYLLNVGPTAEGVIPAPSVERLAEVGRWMKVNGEAVYGTKATPFGREFGKAIKGRSGYGSEVSVSSSNSWRCTTKPGKLYVHLFEWPTGKFTINQVDAKVTKAWLLADPDKKPLSFTYQDNVLSVSLPADAPDKIASVLVLDIEGTASQLPDYLVQSDDGTLKLDASHAEISGKTAKLEEDHIGFWTDPEDSVQWPVEIKKAGTYRLSFDYSLADEASEVVVSAADGSQKVKLLPTGDWKKFETKESGEIRIGEAGKFFLKVSPAAKPKTGVMNLRSVTLSPK